ncbi:MAG: hypothetical protein A3E01_08135 [Gammaproteobacteria bacterium RIFCSPHIGHO2_12_FULL_63_22]|nr:MAG: hypothetical protein A3E01_08135 [Gammaproteobacteria bacterium RIFCSPHIGHO2_12_FULL_63_22]
MKCEKCGHELALQPEVERREKTIPELQAEIGRLTQEFQYRVLGLPSEGFTAASWPSSTLVPPEKSALNPAAAWPFPASKKDG